MLLNIRVDVSILCTDILGTKNMKRDIWDYDNVTDYGIKDGFLYIHRLNRVTEYINVSIINKFEVP